MFYETQLSRWARLVYRPRQNKLERLGMVAAIAYVHPDDAEALHLAADAINARRGIHGGAIRPLPPGKRPPFVTQGESSTDNPSISDLLTQAHAGKSGEA